MIPLQVPPIGPTAFDLVISFSCALTPFFVALFEEGNTIDLLCVTNIQAPFFHSGQFDLQSTGVTNNSNNVSISFR